MEIDMQKNQASRDARIARVLQIAVKNEHRIGMLNTHGGYATPDEQSQQP